MSAQIGRVLSDAAQRTPDATALVELGPDGRSTATYRELDAGARGVAAALAAEGLEPGDRIALLADNSRLFVETWMGAAYAGLVIVPIPPTSAPPEIDFRLRTADCRLLLKHPPPELKHPGTGTSKHPVARAPDDPAMILFTSGTTGSAKGAVITHGSLSAHTDALVEHTLRLGADDVVLGALPLTHSYGIRMCVLAPFRAGARSVVMPRFRAESVLATLAAEGVTWLPVVPTMLSALVRTGSEPVVLPGLRWCMTAGAPLTEDLRSSAETLLGVEVRQGYGLTEATFSTIDGPPSPPGHGTVGRPVHGIEVRIVDGGIEVRGQNVMREYLDDPAATAEVLHDGWLRTGDVGHLDEEGRLVVIDRAKDLIIRGGNNVVPSEVEDALAAHPAVVDVAVVGRPDPHWGEEVVAVIVADGDRPSPAELDAWARTRLASTKVPRELAFVEALPLGPSGKVLKRELRADLEHGRLVARPITPSDRPRRRDRR